MELRQLLGLNLLSGLLGLFFPCIFHFYQYLQAQASSWRMVLTVWQQTRKFEKDPNVRCKVCLWHGGGMEHEGAGKWFNTFHTQPLAASYLQPPRRGCKCPRAICGSPNPVSPNSVSTLRGSYGSCKGRCLIRVLQMGRGIFSLHFRMKWLFVKC